MSDETEFEPIPEKPPVAQTEVFVPEPAEHPTHNAGYIEPQESK